LLEQQSDPLPSDFINVLVDGCEAHDWRGSKCGPVKPGEGYVSGHAQVPLNEQFHCTQGNLVVDRDDRSETALVIQPLL
jgi:hypothetical protein